MENFSLCLQCIILLYQLADFIMKPNMQQAQTETLKFKMEMWEGDKMVLLQAMYIVLVACTAQSFIIIFFFLLIK